MELLKKLLTNKKFWIGVIFFISGVVITRLFDRLIILFFPLRPQPDDLLFRLLPYSILAGYIFDLCSMFGTLLVSSYIFIKKPEKVPKFMTTIGVLYIVRSFITILTPLANSSGLGVNTGLFGLLQQGAPADSTAYLAGMFPSGHTALATFMYLTIDKKDKLYKRIMLILLCVELLTALLTRAHYSIDLVGGLMLALMITPYMDRFDKYLVLKPNEIDTK
ncbi:MAG: hypothetical protein Fur003_4890 [Candidatus Dojkabacteria bacterium]